METVTNDVLATKIETLTTAFKDFQATVVSKENLELTLKAYDLKIAEINSRITVLSAELTTKTNNINTAITSRDKKNWVQNTMSALIGVIITGLVSLCVFLVQSKAGH